MKASACQKWLPVASQIPSGTSVAIDPRIGPASPTRASAARVVCPSTSLRSRRPGRG